jgi:hypothetical protein
MTLAELKATLSSAAPPAALSPALAALWEDAKGRWDTAHQIAQDITTPDGAWIHAYLHRKEGDASNAAYWYRNAGKPVAQTSLEAEWDQIATTLLGQL